nr:MAG TPA: hypothetical protein [Caudoviricetes sp.]
MIFMTTKKSVNTPRNTKKSTTETRFVMVVESIPFTPQRT